MVSTMENRMNSIEKLVDEHNQTLQKMKKNLEQVRVKVSKVSDMDQIKNLLLELQHGKKTPDAKTSSEIEDNSKFNNFLGDDDNSNFNNFLGDDKDDMEKEESRDAARRGPRMGSQAAAMEYSEADLNEL
ncbi:unnamed protein product [Vicia faba]|uniref:Uncharacterized protein n=1 Tax=Vicia faba TaxID=3906 RepID=A0AAV1BEB1_VICFA|nr:unnamed protein product [Vicia faba]